MFESGSQDSSDSNPEAWRENLNKDIPTTDWMGACSDAQLQTINTQLKLLQYNWLICTYITPSKLHRFNNDIPDSCTKCNELKRRFVWE